MFVQELVNLLYSNEDLVLKARKHRKAEQNFLIEFISLKRLFLNF